MMPEATLPTTTLPILYSFRRCPYAMRARLALHSSAQAYVLREIALKNKPAELLAASAKATVPVLCLPNGQVLDQSLEIMLWALRQHDPQHWLPDSPIAWARAHAQIASNDGAFKHHLDRYKYPHRFGLSDPAVHRDLGAQQLHSLEQHLQAQPYLAGAHWGLQDACLAPFVRQFAHTQTDWFAQQAWPALQQWLQAFESSAAFAQTMQKSPLWVAPA
jgi:glutathione S-transferase